MKKEKMRLDSNIESKSSNNTYLNIIEIFNKLELVHYDTFSGFKRSRDAIYTFVRLMLVALLNEYFDDI